MRNRIAIAAIASVLSAQAEPLDRIAVTIGSHVITESSVILDLRVGAFLDRKEVDLSSKAKRGSAERLTDQVLILQEAAQSRLALPTQEAAATMLNQMKKRYAGEAEYRTDLALYKITEEDVTKQFLSGLIMLVFGDQMFLTAAQVSEAELRAYYERVKEGASFEASRDEIEKLLMQKRADEALDVWLQTGRQAAGVQFREKVFQ